MRVFSSEETMQVRGRPCKSAGQRGHLARHNWWLWFLLNGSIAVMVVNLRHRPIYCGCWCVSATSPRISKPPVTELESSPISIRNALQLCVRARAQWAICMLGACSTLGHSRACLEGMLTLGTLQTAWSSPRRPPLQPEHFHGLQRAAAPSSSPPAWAVPMVHSPLWQPTLAITSSERLQLSEERALLSL